MRNLKKILALVLALVMSMSLVVTANAFSDDDAINEVYREAATVLNGLEVLKGRDNGNFDPKANISRAEVAAIVYRITTADVTDKQTNIYAESAKGLTDVNGWYNGYVGYCYNSQYIKGYSDNTFKPMNNVTGHEALAMLLRAIGYGKNGEFEGANWALNTAARAKALGLTQNINEGLLSQPATREMVAEMAFRALTAETVTWSLGLDYQGTGKTLGDNFKLVEFNGVITANEYADLYDTDAIAEGKTKLDDEVTYTYTSTLEDIGEARHGWAAFNNKTVLFIEDTAANAWETGAATANLKKDSGIAVTDAEHFVNFDADVESREADMLITYSTTGQAKDAVSIKEGKVITKAQLADIRAIFDHEEYQNAWVVVGTKVGDDNEKNDISNEISYKKFLAEYTNEIAKNNTEVKNTVNGDWLKIIDNDGDGSAEYVFKTEFTMEQVIGLSKKGVLTLTGDKANTVFGSDKTEPYKTSAELAAGDVVLYAVIDGVAYVELAPSFTGEVDSYSMKKDILTVDGTEYGQSGINENTGYENEIAYAVKKTEYTFYQDHFGFIRVFAYPTEGEGDYVLLTDGWYREKRDADEYAVKAYLDGEIKDTDVDADYTGNFIRDTSVTQNNSWGNLNSFIKYGDHATKLYTGNTVTNLAFYVMSDEGVLSLGDAKSYNYGKKHQEVSVKTDYVDLYETAMDKGQATYKGQYIADANEVGAINVGRNLDIQATKDTVFYYVTLNANGDAVKSVKTVTGYKHTPAIDQNNVSGAYAVATNTGVDANGDNYWVADVIVIELKKDTVSYEDVFFNIYSMQKSVKDTVLSNAILADASITDELLLNLGDNYNQYVTGNRVKVPTWFYQKTAANEDGVVNFDAILSDYTEHHIYAATADRINSLKTYLTTANGTELEYVNDEVVVYALTSAKNDKYNDPIVEAVTELDNEDVIVRPGEDLIVVCDNKDDVSYIINVTATLRQYIDLLSDDEYVPSHDTLIDQLNALYMDIVEDAKPTESARDVADRLLKNGIKNDKDAADAAWAISELTKTGASESDKLTAAALQAKLDAYNDAQGLTELKKTWKNKVDALNTTNGAKESVKAEIEGMNKAQLEALTDAAIVAKAKTVTAAQDAKKTAVDNAGAAANDVKAGTVVAADLTDYNTAIENAYKTADLDQVVADATKDFANKVLAAINGEFADGFTAKVADVTDEAQVKAAVEAYLTNKGYDLATVTVAAAEPVSETVVGVTTITSEITVKFSTGDDVKFTVNVEAASAASIDDIKDMLEDETVSEIVISEDLTIDEALTIPAGKTLTVAEGKALTIETMPEEFEGTIAVGAGSTLDLPVLEVAEGASSEMIGVNSLNITEGTANVTANENGGISVTIDGDATIAGGFMDAGGEDYLIAKRDEIVVNGTLTVSNETTVKGSLVVNDLAGDANIWNAGDLKIGETVVTGTDGIFTLAEGTEIQVMLKNDKIDGYCMRQTDKKQDDDTPSSEVIELNKNLSGVIIYVKNGLTLELGAGVTLSAPGMEIRQNAKISNVAAGAIGVTVTEDSTVVGYVDINEAVSMTGKNA